MSVSQLVSFPWAIWLFRRMENSINHTRGCISLKAQSRFCRKRLFLLFTHRQPCAKSFFCFRKKLIQMTLFNFYFYFQVIGCLGALRLNERLLNAYWLILLILLVGDVIVGGIWLVRYDRISKDLQKDLQDRFSKEYSDERSEFRLLWDDLQK